MFNGTLTSLIPSRSVDDTAYEDNNAICNEELREENIDLIRGEKVMYSNVRHLIRKPSSLFIHSVAEPILIQVDQSSLAT